MNPYVMALMLTTLRLGPVFVIAPPFSLIRVPQRVRVCLVLALAATLAPLLPMQLPSSQAGFVVSALSELMLGFTFALALQLAFTALSFAGRMLDIQAGFGLAMVIDPGSRAQSPLFGMVFALTGAMIFLAGNGHIELIRTIVATARAVPVGQAVLTGNPQLLARYLSIVMGCGLGAVTATVITLFLIDIAIALLSRALPQMNALLLGFQVKTIATLIVLAASAGLLFPTVLRLVRYSLEFILTVATP